MGAPKQKWTPEEETALKAGVVKHGPGKWRTILKDPDFSGILSLRSNVDLKDKWRNMSVTANGWGSREKARLALKKIQHMSRSEEDMSDTSQEAGTDEEIVDTKPLSVAIGSLQTASSKQSRLESLIIEAITSLKEPNGSNKPNIAMYIEDQYKTPPNFKKLLSAKLKSLTASGKLIKVNRKYRIATSASFSQAKRTPGVPLVEERNRDSIKNEKDDIQNLMKSHIDADFAKMRTMNIQDAAAAAARAVAEAEAAMAEAEEAAKVAEVAEADADAALAFAEAAMSTLKNKYTNNLMVHG